MSYEHEFSGTLLGMSELFQMATLNLSSAVLAGVPMTKFQVCFWSNSLLSSSYLPCRVRSSLLVLFVNELAILKQNERLSSEMS